MSEDYVVLGPGPNFDLFFGALSNPATAQVPSPTPERSPAGDDCGKAGGGFTELTVTLAEEHGKR